MAGKAVAGNTRGARVAATDRSLADGPFELLASKLLAPRMRSSAVDRPSLIERLCDVDGPPIVAVTAPAGYGKTTLLAQWAEADERDFAWVSLDGSDNDPHILLSYIAASLDQIDRIDPSVSDALASSGTSIAGVVVPRLGRALPDVAVAQRVVGVAERVGRGCTQRQCADAGGREERRDP